MALITPARTPEIFDTATLVFVHHNFSVGLTNDRIGVMQTDYVPLPVVQATQPDTLQTPGRLIGLEMRLTLSVNERAGDSLLHLRASIRRTDGRPSETDSVIARYWLEHLAYRLADGTEGAYERSVTRRMYFDAVAARGPITRRDGMVRAAGMVTVALFVATLLTAVAAPGGE